MGKVCFLSGPRPLLRPGQGSSPTLRPTSDLKGWSPEDPPSGAETSGVGGWAAGKCCGFPSRQGSRPEQAGPPCTRAGEVGLTRKLPRRESGPPGHRCGLNTFSWPVPSPPSRRPAAEGDEAGEGHSEKESQGLQRSLAGREVPRRRSRARAPLCCCCGNSSTWLWGGQVTVQPLCVGVGLWPLAGPQGGFPRHLHQAPPSGPPHGVSP